MNSVVYGILIGLCFYAIETVNACPTTGTIAGPVVSLNVSCNNLLFSANGFLSTIVWNSGPNSTLLCNIIGDSVDGENVITVVGNITSGQYVGLYYISAYTLPTLDITACASTDGLPSVSGPGIGILGLNLFTTSQSQTYTPGLTNTVKPTLVGGSNTITFTLPTFDCV